MSEYKHLAKRQAAASSEVAFGAAFGWRHRVATLDAMMRNSIAVPRPWPSTQRTRRDGACGGRAPHGRKHCSPPQTLLRNAVNCSDPRAESFLKSWHGKRYEMQAASGIAV